MATPAETSIVLQLNSIQELFVAPAANPFSAHEVDILGQAGMDCILKRVTGHWPRQPRSVAVTLQVPVAQLTPDLEERTRAAVQRYCGDKLDANRLQRQLTIRRSLRQLRGVFVAILLAVPLIAVLVANPLGLLPDFLRGVLVVLTLYACSVLSFDALWSVAFDWVPFAQDMAVYRAMQAMEVGVEVQADP